MNHKNWKENSLPPAKLTLDKLNPRLPDMGKNPSEINIIQELVENDKVYELAQSITKNGYLPGEYLFVCKEDSKTIVIEGNRRVAACKLLINPDIAPSAFRSRFRSLANNFDINEIATLLVFIAPNRNVLAPLIVSKHTEPTIEHWEPLMKANFYARQVLAGAAIDGLSKNLNVPASEIKRALVRYQIYEKAKTLKLSSRARAVVEDPRQFNMTTLARVFEKPIGKTFLGISLDNKGILKFKVSKKVLDKRLKRIVEDVATGIKNSRDLNTDEEIKKYLEQIKGGKITLEDKKSKQISTKNGVLPKVGAGLIPSNLQHSISSPRLLAVLDELQRPLIKKYPNACSVLLRVFLELATYEYLKKLKELPRLKTELGKKGKLNPVTFPELGNMLRWIVSQDLLTDDHVKQKLKNWVSKNSKTPILDDLNLYVHNSITTPDEPTLRKQWKELEEFFKLILS
jgi:hypothetical protein